MVFHIHKIRKTDRQILGGQDWKEGNIYVSPLEMSPGTYRPHRCHAGDERGCMHILCATPIPHLGMYPKETRAHELQEL